MGMYTGLKLDVTLHETEFLLIKPALDFMVGPQDAKVPPECADHPLFECERWRGMFFSSSSYLDKDFEAPPKLVGNRLTVEFNLKNYDGEIEYLMDWISPFVVTVHTGFYQYEEMIGMVPVSLKDGKLEIDKMHKNNRMDY